MEQWLGLSPHSPVGSVWSLHVLLVLLLGFSSGFLPHADMQIRLIGDSKLPVGVNVSVSSCMSLYVGPVTDWRPVQGVPSCSPNGSWDQLQHPHDPVEDKVQMMDGCVFKSTFSVINLRTDISVKSPDECEFPLD